MMSPTPSMYLQTPHTGSPDMLIRPSADADLPTIHAIYEREVRDGLATFELDVPDVNEMARRRVAVLAAGMPYLVAERAGRVVGYAYAGTYRPRPAYRFTVEDSVYIAPGNQGEGIGRALLAALLEGCEAGGARQAVAIITSVPELGIGDASVHLHVALGFEHAGTLRAAGWKHGRWLDTIRMQRALGEGGTTPPA